MSGIRIDLRLWNKLRRKLERGNRLSVQVGVLPEKGGNVKRGDITMAELATIHEFGSPAAGIPERSFIRSTTLLKKREIAAKTRDATRRVIAAVPVERGLEEIGKFVAEEIKNRMLGGEITPALKSSTVARKGSDTPLVDTGRLAKAVKWKVTKR